MMNNLEMELNYFKLLFIVVLLFIVFELKQLQLHLHFMKFLNFTNSFLSLIYTIIIKKYSVIYNMTPMQIKMAKLRAMKKNAPKKGGCGGKKCSPKCQDGKGPKLDKVIANINKNIELIRKPEFQGKPVKKPKITQAEFKQMLVQKQQQGEGPRLDKVIAVVKKGIELGKKGVEFGLKNKDKILKGLKVATEVAGVAGSVTGSKALKSVGDLRGFLGKGDNKKKRLVDKEVKNAVLGGVMTQERFDNLTKKEKEQYMKPLMTKKKGKGMKGKGELEEKLKLLIENKEEPPTLDAPVQAIPQSMPQSEINTGELEPPVVYYPNSSSLFTGRLVF